MGVSLEQILSACHWKLHNTFTQFYLKDVAWADMELFHLGPVVAAQQVHHQAKKMRRYVNMYIDVYLYIMQKKTNCDLLPLGSLFLMGLNSTPSSYFQSRFEKKGGGGNAGRLPDNRLVVADLDLTGLSDPRSNWAFEFCSVYEFT